MRFLKVGVPLPVCPRGPKVTPGSGSSLIGWSNDAAWDRSAISVSAAARELW